MEILINPPKEIFVTKEEFLHFTYYDLACFWCNWKVAFHFDDNMDIVMYTKKEDLCDMCCRNHRFKNIQWYEIPRAGMFKCTIPKENDMYEFIVEKLDYLIMK